MTHQWADILSSWTSLTIFASLRQRDKLPQHNTIDNAVELIRKSQRILILTGAGISMFNHFWFSLLFIFLRAFPIGVSCGIPDFRSRDGLYASLKNQGEYDLDDPQQMYEIFRSIPKI
jgi:Sir2 family